MLLGSDPVLAVHDLAGSADWFARVFDAHVFEPAPGWLFCRAGEVLVRLGACPDSPPAAGIGDHSYLAYLYVEDVDAVHERAVAAGAEVLHPPRDEPWGVRELALRHPEGHRFMVAGPLEG